MPARRIASSKSFRTFRTNKFALFCLLVLGTLMPSAQGAELWGIDLSFSGSYSRQDYGLNQGFSFYRRWSAGISYQINEVNSIELYYAQNYSESHLTGYQDTSIQDQVYSIDWVQSLWNSEDRVVPYVKIGVGNLQRRAVTIDAETNTTAGDIQYNTLSGILGIGLLIRAHERLSLRAEATTYLPGARISQWKDNYSLNVGVTVHL